MRTNDTPITAVPALDGPRTWFSPSVLGLLPGMALAPTEDDDTMWVADSHEMAVACWRDANPFLGYYRVIPDDEPVQIPTVPGLYRCKRAIIVESVHNGSRWTDEHLWHLVERAQWPDGSPIYDDAGHITEPSGVPVEAPVHRAFELLKNEQYLLPSQAAQKMTAFGGRPVRDFPSNAA